MSVLRSIEGRMENGVCMCSGWFFFLVDLLATSSFEQISISWMILVAKLVSTSSKTRILPATDTSTSHSSYNLNHNMAKIPNHSVASYLPSQPREIGERGRGRRGGKTAGYRIHNQSIALSTHQMWPCLLVLLC